MTIADIFNAIVNYNLNNVGEDFVSPLVKVGGFMILVALAFGAIAIVLMLIFSFVVDLWVSRKTKDIDTQVVKSLKKELNLDKHSWNKVGNQSGLYCYCCTNKLPIQSWENKGNFYCDECYKKFSG